MLIKIALLIQQSSTKDRQRFNILLLDFIRITLAVIDSEQRPVETLLLLCCRIFADGDVFVFVRNSSDFYHIPLRCGLIIIPLRQDQ